MDFQDEYDSPRSPNKRRKSPTASRKRSGDGCKLCTCKMSKCLKLYCECFAAGLYCAGSCTCQDCFNKPEHGETVLNTRQQIESRNPLAFAPKIIHSGDASPKRRQEELIETPASARHKRGCNCKKSLCLKKYCECFQVGVGCSEGCRCEGCKNVYGRKGAVDDSDDKDITSDALERGSPKDICTLTPVRQPPLRPTPASITSGSPKQKRVYPPQFEGLTGRCRGDGRVAFDSPARSPLGLRLRGGGKFMMQALPTLPPGKFILQALPALPRIMPLANPSQGQGLN